MKALLLGFLLTAFVANAGVLVEPYFGYAPSLGGIDRTIAPGNTIIIDYGSWDLGTRAGYIYKIFMAGIDVDFTMMRPTYQFQDNEFRPSVTTWNLGVFVGFWLKNNLNVRASYFPTTNWIYREFSNENIPINDGDAWRGDGFSIAVGWRVYKFVGINFEYKKFYYREFAGQEIGIVNQFRPDELLFTASLPFNLFEKTE